MERWRPSTSSDGDFSKSQMQLTAKPGMRRMRRGQAGFTLVELIVAITIMMVLTMMAIPVARLGITREKEKELRYDLWMMRDAIDRYKDAADRGAFQTKVGTENYPPDLETLVKGVDVGGKKIRF